MERNQEKVGKIELVKEIIKTEKERLVNSSEPKDKLKKEKTLQKEVKTINLEKELKEIKREGEENSNECNEEKQELIEDVQESNDDESMDLINKVRATGTSKNIKSSEISKPKAKTRRDRHARLHRENISVSETDDIKEPIEESKENNPASFMNNQNQMLEMLNRGKQSLTSPKNTPTTTEKLEEPKINTEVEEMKYEIEESKTETVEEKDENSQKDSLQDESKGDGYYKEQSIYIKPSKSSSKSGDIPKQKVPRVEKKKNLIPKHTETVQCNYCQTKGNSNYDKFQKNIENLVVETIKDQLPTLLNNTVK